nr:serine/threonine-protein phosphatase 2A 55 kDa regulatory subunit B delta isoform [Vicugna pacos]XP_031529861.1 serine/threonine-protein phosphatase 2A 55 kDa regulatory subunit B delta isoform [Vicugna pacos]
MTDELSWWFKPGLRRSRLRVPEQLPASLAPSAAASSHDALHVFLGRDLAPVWQQQHQVFKQKLRTLCFPVFEEPEDPSSRSFSSENISSVSDVKFSHSGRYVLTQDYPSVKVWDLNMESRPVETHQGRPRRGWPALCPRPPRPSCAPRQGAPAPPTQRPAVLPAREPLRLRQVRGLRSGCDGGGRRGCGGLRADGGHVPRPSAMTALRGQWDVWPPCANGRRGAWFAGAAFKCSVG